MNLRQKVKLAKRELKVAEENLKNARTSLGIYEAWQKVDKLRTIVNYKRKPNSNFNWNENDKVDMNNLTYVELKVDDTTLYKKVSPNGKPFNKREIAFINKEITKRIANNGRKVAKENRSNENYVDYYLLLSDFKTKQKKLATKELFRQFEGHGELYTQ